MMIYLRQNNEPHQRIELSYEESHVRLTIMTHGGINNWNIYMNWEEFEIFKSKVNEVHKPTDEEYIKENM